MFVLAMIVCAALLPGCSSSRQHKLFEYAPASSVVAAYIDWSSVRQDDALKDVLKPQDVGRFFEALSLKDDDVGEMLIFGGGGGNIGVVMRGVFDTDAVIENLKSRDWREQSNERDVIYTRTNSEEYLAATDDLLVVGTRGGVMSVLDREGGEDLTRHPVYEKLSDYLDDSDAPVTVVFAAPQKARDMTSAALKISSAMLDLAQLGAITGFVEQLGAVEGVGCTLNHNDGVFPIEMIALMKDEETASLVSGTLNLAQSFASLASQNNLAANQKQSLNQLQQLNVTRDANILSIRATMTAAQLQTR